MTEEEKAEEYAGEKCKECYMCDYADYEHPEINPYEVCPWYTKRKEGYLDGLAEGKKEVTYMKAEEYDEYLDACRKNIELEKENAKLKAENKQIIERERVVPEHYLIEMIEKCKELKAQIEEQKTHCKAVDEMNEKMRCCENCKHNGSDSEIGENGDYTDYTCIQCDDFSTKENPYPNWELAE